MPKPRLYRFLPIPPDFNPKYCTIAEACSFAKCSPWTAYQRLRQGRWKAVKDGRVNKIIFASIKADMAALPERPQGAPSRRPPEKRPVGRPRKHPKPETQPSPGAE